MHDWHFFPPVDAVFADNGGDYFVPLATVDISLFIPDRSGPVHFLRPRMSQDRVAARQSGEGPYFKHWFAFQRDAQGRYQSMRPLSGEVTPEAGDAYDTLYCGNAKARYEAGEIGAEDLLSCSDLTGVWPNANWNDGQTAQALTGRPLRFLGELDTVNFSKNGTAGSVLLLDEQNGAILQVFHST